jgi:hypothetical protein
VHNSSTFSAQTNHGQTQTHTTHHNSDLRETTTFPLKVFFMPTHGANTQMSFCPKTFKLGISKFPKLGLSQLWKPITSFGDLWMRWGLKKHYSLRQDLFNRMWHVTCTQINWGDFLILMVGSQIGNLIPNLSFGHNLCFKYQNGSCKPILDI